MTLTAMTEQQGAKEGPWVMARSVLQFSAIRTANFPRLVSVPVCWSCTDDAYAASNTLKNGDSRGLSEPLRR